MAKKISPIDLPRPAAAERTPWPQSPKDLSPRPRVFRIQRLNQFEWQAYVIGESGEAPIGKPDLFDILKNKVMAVMRAEGQQEYMANLTKAAKATDAS